jgi:DNA excision repair protein ERCC-5
MKEFRRRHASVRKNWDLPEDFPQRAIMQAYINPRVDDSKQNFTYGRPDLELLRQFCWDKFGWSKDKTEQLLLPVLKVIPCSHCLVCLFRKGSLC